MNDDRDRDFAAHERECVRARAQAAAWLDGDYLDEPALLAHAASCAACSEHVSELRDSAELLRGLRAAGEPAVDLWPAIALRVRPTPSRLRVRVWRIRVARAAAAVAGFAATAAFLSRLGRESAPQAGERSWTAALHAESIGVRELVSAPEQQLLAALDRTLPGRTEEER